MKKIILISVIIGALGTLSYFTYSIVADRYFPESEKTEEKKSDGSPIIGSEYQNNSVKNEDKPINENTPAEENPNTSDTSEKIIENFIESTVKKNNSSPSNIKANITPQHCKDDCKAFATDLTIFAYCEQVCGISPIKDISNCDSKKDLEKDYCQKDLAISKSDASLCESIKDDNIKKTCTNRIYENFLEKMSPGSDKTLEDQN